MGSRPAVVRVVARRRARSRSIATRTASVASCVVAARRRMRRPTSRRVGTPGSTGARAGIACIRSGGRTAPQLTVLDPATGARDVAAPRCARPSSTRSTCPNPRRSRGPAPTARRCTACCGSRPSRRVTPAATAAAAGRRARRTHRPGDGRLEAARSASSCRAGGRCCSPNYRGSTGYGRAYRARARPRVGRRRRRRHRRRHPRRRRTTGWADASRAAVMGGSAGGFTALLVAAQHAAGRARGGEPVRRHRSLRPRRHHAPVRVALPRPSRRDAARARRPLRGALTGHARARRSRCRCSCCRAPTTRWCRPRRRSCSSTRCAPRAATVEHHVYDGRRARLLQGSHHRRLLRTHRRVPHDDGWSNDDGRTRRSW